MIITEGVWSTLDFMTIILTSSWNIHNTQHALSLTLCDVTWNPSFSHPKSVLYTYHLCSLL